MLYSSHNVNFSSDNLVSDQLIIPSFILFLIRVTCLLDSVRRNSVLITKLMYEKSASMIKFSYSHLSTSQRLVKLKIKFDNNTS